MSNRYFASYLTPNRSGYRAVRINDEETVAGQRGTGWARETRRGPRRGANR